MNGFQFNPYGFMNPYQQQMQPAQPPVQVVKVNGENGAKAYSIGANSSALLLDESGLMVWLVTTDGAGYKTVSAYDIIPHQTVPAPDLGSLESRIQTIEKKLEEMTNNGNPRNVNANRKVKSDDGSD
jgi:hypothetical protein